MNDTKCFYIYVGHAEPPHSSWKFIPDTPEELQRAIEDGYTASSTMSFEYEPEKGKPEPVRRGSLILDFDSKRDPSLAVIIARDFITWLVEENYQIDPECLRYWMSGGKGCHIEIPAAMYGGEAGHPDLPLIQKTMLMMLPTGRFHHPKFCEVLDFSLYCRGQGKLLRLPNIKRPNGRYKVPVSAWEFFKLDYPALERLTLEPRPNFDVGTKEPILSQRMAKMYADIADSMRAFSNRANPVSGIEALFNCNFITHCFNDRETLPEPHWWVMVSILATFGEAGRKMIHEFSQGYPGYSFEETEKKINTAKMKQGRGPIGCDYIRSLSFECGKQCDVRSPADLWKHKRSEETRRAMAYIHKPDGLYREPDNGSEEQVKICSPLKVLGKMRSPEGVGWARLVEIETSDGRKKEVCVHMRDMKGRGDAVISQLLDSGLDICFGSKTQQYLMDYIMNGAPNDSPLLCVQRVGWIDKTYILPDASYGGELTEKIHFQSEGKDNLYQVSGTLAEWQEHVGRYCRGNSLLELLASYALTGPLLKLVGLEGGGIHLFGPSSTGKTTILLIIGSICGGGGNRGFCVQWRATDNALEAVATLHNDGLLVIDEISQATGGTVYHAVYMLANGQGKERLRRDASRVKPYRWLLNFLSSGELTINDKIQEFGKYTAMAGQDVRVIDLPIDGLGTGNAFQDLHGLADGSQFSNIVGRNARQYYGSPLRAFLAVLCEDLEDNVTKIMADMKAFVEDYCPADASGQVKRVASKFALDAAAGELGISFGVLPFEPGAAKKAAGEWFKIWLEGRSGHGDLEIIKAIKRIQEHLARNPSRYMDLDLPYSSPSHYHEGYAWKQGGKQYYLMLTSVFNELTRGTNQRTLKDELERLGYVARCEKGGNVMRTKSVNGASKSGVILIPSAWEGEPDPDEIEKKLQKAKGDTIEDLFEG